MSAMSLSRAARTPFQSKVCEHVTGRLQSLGPELETERARLVGEEAELRVSPRLAEAERLRAERHAVQRAVKMAANAVRAAEGHLRKTAEASENCPDAAEVEAAEQASSKLQAQLQAFGRLERRTEEPFVCLVQDVISRILLASQAPHATGQTTLGSKGGLGTTFGKENQTDFRGTAAGVCFPRTLATPVRNVAAPNSRATTSKQVCVEDWKASQAQGHGRPSVGQPRSAAQMGFSWLATLKTLLALGAAGELKGARAEAARQLIEAVAAMDSRGSAWLQERLRAAATALQGRLDRQDSQTAATAPAATPLPPPLPPARRDLSQKTEVEEEGQGGEGQEEALEKEALEEDEEVYDAAKRGIQKGFTEVPVFQPPRCQWPSDLPQAASALKAIAQVPLDASLVLVLGPTGAGKTQTLAALAARLAAGCGASDLEAPAERTLAFYSDRAVASHPALKGCAVERFGSAGLSDVPAWTRPFQALSNGQRARVVVAAALSSGAVFDDFCSTVDERTAWAAAASMSKQVRRQGLKHVIVACSRGSLAPWLAPDFVIWLPAAAELSDFTQAVVLQNPVLPAERRPRVTLESDRVRSFLRGKGGGWQGRRDAGALQEDASWAEWAEAADDLHTAQESLELRSQVQLDDAVMEAAGAFDYAFDGSSCHVLRKVPESELPGGWALGLLCGPSGCGKTSLLRSTASFGKEAQVGVWREGVPICDHDFPSSSEPEPGLQEGRAAAERRLALLGLRRECWQLPFEALSAGEQHQAVLARCLRPGCWVDEFTSSLDRATAKQVCRGVRALADAGDLKGTVLAAVHEDVVAWLEPDWAFHVPLSQLASSASRTPVSSSVPSGHRPDLVAAEAEAEVSEVSRLLRPSEETLFSPPELRLEMSCLQHEQQSTAWRQFEHHHYLSSSLLSCSKSLLVRDASSGALVAFHAVAPLPGAGALAGAWREHRLVVLPRFQGFGIGPRLSELVAAKLLATGCPFYAVTAHPRLGGYRDSIQGQKLWSPTSMNGKATSTTLPGHKRDRAKPEVTGSPRVCWRHRFTGGLSQAAWSKKCGIKGVKALRLLEQVADATAEDGSAADEVTDGKGSGNSLPEISAPPSFQNHIKPLPTQPDKTSITQHDHQVPAENDRRMVFSCASQNPQLQNLARDHPDMLAEPRNLASVRPPPLDPEKHVLCIPQQGLEEGRLSSCQLETVFYAARCFGRKLASGETCGYFLGDGTGCGKGRIITALILHLWNQGHRRHVWVSAQNDLLEDARRDLSDVAMNMADVGSDIPLLSLRSCAGKAKLPEQDGVLFATYALLCGQERGAGAGSTHGSGRGHGKGRGRGKKRKQEDEDPELYWLWQTQPEPEVQEPGLPSCSGRLGQVVEWLSGSQGSAQGLICFDEAHKAKNLDNKLGKPTLTGLTVQKLQQACPDAKVLYSTATGASELKNVAYMSRLGLWGPGTSFSSFQQFHDVLSRENLAGFEIFSMEMKAMGVYSARMLSWAETSFKTMPLPLGPRQTKEYNAATSFFQDLRKALQLYRDHPQCPLEPRRRVWLEVQLRGLQQRFFRTLLVAFKVPMAVREVRSCLASDCNVVISLWHTGESSQKRFVDTAEGAGGEEAERDEEDEEGDGDDGDGAQGRGEAPCLAAARCGPRLMLEHFIHTFMPVMLQETGKKLATEVTWASWKDSPVCSVGEEFELPADRDARGGLVRVTEVPSPSTSPETGPAHGTVRVRFLQRPSREGKDEDGDASELIGTEAEAEEFRVVSASKLVLKGKRCRPFFSFEIHGVDDAAEINGVYHEKESEPISCIACFRNEVNTTFYKERPAYRYPASEFVARPAYEHETQQAVIAWDMNARCWTLSRADKIVAYSQEQSVSAPLFDWVPVGATDNDGITTGVIQVSNVKPLAVEGEAWAQELRSKLLEQLQNLALPDNPLDQLLQQLGGPKKVAELSGRRSRLVKASSSSPAQLEKRAQEGERWEYVNLREQLAFQRGEKRVAIITEAASAGISLHADKRATEVPNGRSARKRVMLILELPWSAEKAVQQFGRVHRSNQLYAPAFRLLVTDVGGEQRFVSAVSRRMQQLGAITRGDRNAALGDGDAGLASSDFQGDMGTLALSQLSQAISHAVKHGDLPENFHSCLSQGGPSWEVLRDEARQLIDAGQLRLEMPSKQVKVGGNVKVADFLNSLLGIPVGPQQKVFDLFSSMFGMLVHEAEANGELDNGVQSLNASVGKWTPGIKLLGSEELNTDVSTGATTAAHHLHYDRGMPWDDAQAIYGALDGTDEFEGFYRESTFNIGHQCWAFSSPAVVLLTRHKNILMRQPYYIAYYPHRDASFNPFGRRLLFAIDIRTLVQQGKLQKLDVKSLWKECYVRSEKECIHSIKYGKCKTKGCNVGCRVFHVSIVAGNLLGIYSCLRDVLLQVSHRNIDDEEGGSSRNAAEGRLRLARVTAMDGTHIVGVQVARQELAQVRYVLQTISQTGAGSGEGAAESTSLSRLSRLKAATTGRLPTPQRTPEETLELASTAQCLALAKSNSIRSAFVPVEAALLLSQAMIVPASTLKAFMNPRPSLDWLQTAYGFARHFASTESMAIAGLICWIGSACSAGEKKNEHDE
ncbi:unnamed protein product [Polarella glacialis]|uniref:AAA+ ATPase domain-containing protein n=1 Tax=Polarella glacialis TaxID=89957 RepID=A0A813F0V5_POLGL|nr:unnamed protein product [Polarella glacialis]